MTENETKSYDLPMGEDFATMTSDVAQSEIDKVLSAASVDKEHPYANAHGYKHTAHVERMGKLFEIAGKGKQTPIEKACQEGLDRQVERQNKLVKEAEVEMAKLVALGFGDVEIPEDLQQYQLDGLRMQRLTAERKFEELTPILDRQLRSLKTPPSLIAAFQSFAQAQEMDDILKANIADQIVAWVYQANEQKYGRKKSED